MIQLQEIIAQAKLVPVDNDDKPMVKVSSRIIMEITQYVGRLIVEGSNAKSPSQDD
jgi:hypothetical protein